MGSKYRDLVEASERLCRTPIVDDDFPEMQHRFHGALREARAELDALQADAREKGEAASGKVNGYLFSQRAIEVIVDGDVPEWMTGQPGIRVTITPESATQPAQASEKRVVPLMKETDRVPDDFRNQAAGYRAGWNDHAGCVAANPKATHPQPVTPAGGEVGTISELGGKVIVLYDEEIIGRLPKGTKLYLHPPVADAALVEVMRKLAAGWRKTTENKDIARADKEYIAGYDKGLRKCASELIAALNQRGGGGE